MEQQIEQLVVEETAKEITETQCCWEVFTKFSWICKSCPKCERSENCFFESEEVTPVGCWKTWPKNVSEKIPVPDEKNISWHLLVCDFWVCRGCKEKCSLTSSEKPEICLPIKAAADQLLREKQERARLQKEARLEKIEREDGRKKNKKKLIPKTRGKTVSLKRNKSSKAVEIIEDLELIALHEREEQLKKKNKEKTKQKETVRRGQGRR